MKTRSELAPVNEYEQQWHGDAVVFDGHGMYISCCDCGLVHQVKPVSGKDTRLVWSLAPEETEKRRKYLSNAGKLADTLKKLLGFL